MQELLTRASCGKGWNRISAKSSLMSPRRPDRTRTWTELNWTVLRRLEVPLTLHEGLTWCVFLFKTCLRPSPSPTPAQRQILRSLRWEPKIKGSLFSSLRYLGLGGIVLSPVHQVWPKPSCKTQWKGEEDKANRGRGGKTTSEKGQA